MTPNRILIVTWEYPPLIEGGLARHVRKLSEALVELGVEVHVLTRGGEQATVEEEMAGVLIHRIVEPKRPTDLAEFVTWVERMNSDMLAAGVELGDRYEFDLVHGHDWLVAGACDHLARRYGVPLVTTIHATEYGRHQGWVEKHPQKHIHGVEKWIANRSDRVIACSHFMREQIAEIFAVDQGHISVIPNGIDPDDLPAEDPTGLAALRSEFAKPDENLVLLIGRLVYEKGFQLALEAMPAVIGALPNTRFLVAGSGTHEAELHKQAEELGLMTHGTFLGWIGDDVLHSLYRIADLTVVPSIYEPFGLVALEAMASKCPCIAADTGGLREVVPIEGAGLRFRASDPEHLAEAAIQVLGDKELSQRMVEEGLAHIRMFDWADVALQTLELYRGLQPVTAD
ncbi:MAG: glycosyltransferase family 4 protein [Solirubrobacterales bacterium]